jgi:hypothetical protein
MLRLGIGIELALAWLRKVQTVLTETDSAAGSADRKGGHKIRTGSFHGCAPCLPPGQFSNWTGGEYEQR